MKPVFQLTLAGGIALALTACVQTPSTPTSQVPQEQILISSTTPNSGSTTDYIDLGNPESEAAHGVESKNAPKVQSAYPEFWIMSVRASASLEGHEPWNVIDGDPATTWQTLGKPPFPMVKGQFVEIEMNEPTVITDVSVQFMDDRPQNIKIYSYNFSDHRMFQLEATTAPTTEMQTFTIEGGVFTNAIRVEYEPLEDGTTQGIAEMRLDKVPYPQGYPLALDIKAPIEHIERAYYIEFERFFKWPIYNLKRPLADGGVGRMLMATEEHEGGHLEFNLAIDPEQKNMVTLKTWATQPNAHDVERSCIALELIVDDPVYNGRWFIPTYVTRKMVHLPQWYGNKPTPGHWAYATFELPEAVTRGKSEIRLRLQGIGNARRDRAMRDHATPVYEITSHSGFSFTP